MILALTSTTAILVSILGSTALAYFIYFTIQLYFYRLKFKHLPGPPPAKGLLGFYTGNLPHFIEAEKNGIVMCDLINEWLHFYIKIFCFLNLNS